jgi:ABC-2 type transport system permease protein
VPAAVLIAMKDLRQRFRDRSAIVLGFVAPVLIAFLMSAAFGGAQDLHATIAVVDEDGGQLAVALVDALTSPELADLLTVERQDRAEAAPAVEDGDLEAALVIPAGFTDAVIAGRPAELEVLAGVDNALSAAVTRAIAESFLTQVQASRIAVATAIAAGAPTTDLTDLAERAAATAPAAALEDQPLGGRELDLISYYAPSMAIFFVFYAIAFTTKSYFVEHREGTLDRMAAAPIPRRAILTGKALSVLVYGSASLGTMAVVTSLAFGADWGPPPAVAAVILAVVLAVMALTALVIAVARTERQAEGLASIITFTLALLGGNFVFVAAAPEALRRAALLTPNGWALRGFTDLATGAAASAAVEPVLAILAFAAVTSIVAAAFGRDLATR